MRAAERRAGQGDGPLAFSVARGYFRLLAIKDEYEVARLYSDGTFAQDLQQRFSGAYKIRFHMAPPLLARPDRATGYIRKQQLRRVDGPPVSPARTDESPARNLARCFQLHGRTTSRATVIGEYRQTIENLLAALTADNYQLAVEIAALPERIRGFGHVKIGNIARAKQCEAELLAAFSDAALVSRHDVP